MTNAEIKKLYTKTKKAYEKRTGDKLTWVMNARQQKLGTATIMYTMAWDYEDRLMHAKKRLESFEADWSKQMAEYNKYAKEEAWKNEHTPGWYFGNNNTFWHDVVTNTEKIAADKERELAKRKEIAAEEELNLSKYGKYSETMKRTIAKAQSFIAEPEVQEFITAIGGQAVVEPKENKGSDHAYRCAEIYVRFYYTAQ